MRTWKSGTLRLDRGLTYPDTKLGPTPNPEVKKEMFEHVMPPLGSVCELLNEFLDGRQRLYSQLAWGHLDGGGVVVEGSWKNESVPCAVDCQWRQVPLKERSSAG